MSIPTKAPDMDISEDLGAHLSAVGVTMRFGGNTAVDDVSLDVRPGEILGVCGPNGAGKSSLLNVISRVYRATSGEVLLDGSPIQTLAPHKLAGLGVARTFQTAEHFQDFRAADFVMMGRVHRTPVRLLGSALGLPSVRRQERAEREHAEQLLAEFGLKGMADRPLKELAYGDQKVIDFIRAISGRPRLALLDEPTSGTRHRDRELLAQAIRRAADSGCTVVVVDHDVNFLSRCSDRIAVLATGRLIALGDPEEVFSSEAVIKVYSGA